MKSKLIEHTMLDKVEDTCPVVEVTKTTSGSSGRSLTSKASMAMTRGAYCLSFASLPILSATSCSDGRVRHERDPLQHSCSAIDAQITYLGVPSLRTEEHKNLRPLIL